MSVSCDFKINWLQLLQVYQTNTKYFIIGSNGSETKFKVLKIDRTDPKELVIEEDCTVYSLKEIKELVERLHAGNLGKNKSSWKSRGLVQTLTAFGIIGFVRFLEGYYMILITKRSIVAELGCHRFYKVEDTSMIYIPNNSIRINHPDEAKYLRSFQTVDLSSNFYYSYSYDLTNTLQQNITFQYLCNCAGKEIVKNKNLDDYLSYGDDRESANASMSDRSESWCIDPNMNERYLWNGFLKIPIHNESIESNWTINIIHGFLGQIKINVFGGSMFVTLIARRSSLYAGTRFLKRGCNIRGDAANEVETEQIVHSAALTSFLQGHYTSYVQHRASVPLHWFQDITSSVVPAKPPITIGSVNPYFQPTAKHFSQLLKRYGSPVIALNLVKSHSKRSNEYQLGESFRDAVSYLNMFLPNKHKIVYQSLDMAHLSRATKSDVLVKLDMIAKENLLKTGFFRSKSSLFKETLQSDPSWRSMGGVEFGPFHLQTGIVRSNCVDCLDRTNSAQFISAKCALAYQLFSLGVLPQPKINFDTDTVRLFEELFEEHGDIIALQYGGSQLVHTIESYRQTAVFSAHSRDIVTTLSRYYSNTFSDTYKQTAINLFLGLFKPDQEDWAQWDMISDANLHNAEADVLESFTSGKYTNWLKIRLQAFLPLPFELTKAIHAARTLRSSIDAQRLFSRSNIHVDWFDEFYRTAEITSFDEIAGMNAVDTLASCMANGYSNLSPFCSRADKLRNQEVSDRVSSNASTEQSSSSDDEHVLEVRYTADEGIDVVRNGSALPDLKCDLSSDDNKLSPRYTYGDSVMWKPSRKDLNTYHRYISVNNILNKFIPLSAFTQDSSYHVEPPTVDKYSRQIYEKCVSDSRQYPASTLTSQKAYCDYLGALGLSNLSVCW